MELDLFLLHRGKGLGIEFKRQDAPRLTPAMRTAILDLELNELWVIYPGERSYSLGDRVSVRPLASLSENQASI